jgi:protein-tyrosine-phosphatase
MELARDGVCTVLFLCTGNSARSLMAEAALARLGPPRFRARSAGSDPKAAPHPLTLETLEQFGYPTEGLSSKSWDVFAGGEAEPMDVVITVCDAAADESCPVWPGEPLRAHWGVEDPAAFVGSAAERAACFERVHDALRVRVEALVALDPTSLDREAFAARLRSIGERGR